MPVKFIARRAKSPSGPRPTDDAINAFVDFFEAPDLPTARDAFLQRLFKAILIMKFGNLSIYCCDFIHIQEVSFTASSTFRARMTQLF